MPKSEAEPLRGEGVITINVADDDISVLIPDGNTLTIQLDVGKGTLKLNIADAIRAVAYYLGNADVKTTHLAKLSTKGANRSKKQ